jgi:hypothetical protein
LGERTNMKKNRKIYKIIFLVSQTDSGYYYYCLADFIPPPEISISFTIHTSLRSHYVIIIWIRLSCANDNVHQFGWFGSTLKSTQIAYNSKYFTVSFRNEVILYSPPPVLWCRCHGNRTVQLDIVRLN